MRGLGRASGGDEVFAQLALARIIEPVSSYQPVVPSVRKLGRKPEQYLRWIVGEEGPTRAYLNTASLGFSRRDDKAKVARLPGARVRPD